MSTEGPCELTVQSNFVLDVVELLHFIRFTALVVSLHCISCTVTLHCMYFHYTVVFLFHQLRRICNFSR